MKTLNDFLAISNFLADDMTEEQAQRLMDEAKDCLSIQEIEILLDEISSPLYTQVSQYNAEMGGLSRY